MKSSFHAERLRGLNFHVLSCLKNILQSEPVITKNVTTRNRPTFKTVNWLAENFNSRESKINNLWITKMIMNRTLSQLILIGLRNFPNNNPTARNNFHIFSKTANSIFIYNAFKSKFRRSFNLLQCSTFGETLWTFAHRWKTLYELWIDIPSGLYPTSAKIPTAVSFVDETCVSFLFFYKSTKLAFRIKYNWVTSPKRWIHLDRKKTANLPSRYKMRWQFSNFLFSTRFIK